MMLTGPMLDARGVLNLNIGSATLLLIVQHREVALPGMIETARDSRRRRRIGVPPSKGVA